ncbi:L-glutaminase [Propionicimonas paludicola]|uniref:Glutaminase n=1 Tax=Propionicimonas paludicola TaxID=185243 RepID=A0A2A9CVG3_9ACTN|nr:glutaminase A [Propionicimonas paludicola]PFG18141.1 L-glutaminase [Propionicimonas paludicola]
MSESSVARALAATYAEVLPEQGGHNAAVYPSLAGADPEQFGLSVTLVDGSQAEAGDATAEFALMSAAKPFTFAVVCQTLGVARAADELGVNATGDTFNAVEPVRKRRDGRTNPMVNAGAIATCSRLPGTSLVERWDALRSALSAFAGRELRLDEELLADVAATNVRNRELTEALALRGLLVGEPAEALELYSRQSCLKVSARDLGVMAATLAHAGRNPLTGVQVVPAVVSAPVLAVMTTAGLYERSGEWLYQVGLPGKSGLGGGILSVVPGRAGIGSFSPRLDEAGNSVRGRAATAALAARLGWSLFG